MYIFENDTDFNISTIYKYKGVHNVTSYTYEDFDKWYVTTCDTCLTQNISYYLVIDLPNSDSFGHWVYESAIYLPLFLSLKNIHPGIKLHLQCYKKYKGIFCDYFNIPKEDITLTITQNNICFFPLPISSLNKKSICDDYTLQLDAFYTYFEPCDTIPSVNILLMPRQTKENYINNDRKYNIDDIADKIGGDERNIVFHTDSVTVLQEQIRTIRSAKNIILTGGSPYLYNAMLCKNSNIIVLDDVTMRQGGEYIKMKYIDYLIKRNNNVTFISNKSQFTYDDIKEYLVI
jgi:hypothetical protein